MPDVNTYQNEIARLNDDIAALKAELQHQQLQAKNYRESLNNAQKVSSTKPLPKDINPILNQIRKKNLSMKEKKELLFPVLFPSAPQDIYYQWVAPDRITITRDRQWYWTMALLLMIMVAIAVIFREMMWVAVVLSFFFAIYVHNSIPGAYIVYKLTRQGIEIGEGEGLEIYAWEQLLDYGFYFKHGQEVLYVDTIIGMPERLQLLFTQEDRKNISMIMESHLPYRPVPKKQNWLTRITDGVYIPIQDFKALQQKIDQYYDSKYAEIIMQLKKTGSIPKDVSIEDVRNAENMKTLKLMDEIQRRQEEETKRILGI